MGSATFIKKVTIVAGGSAGAQAVSILASPLLTRLYQPDDFGVLSVYLAVVSMALVVASFRYEYAIPIPTVDEDAFHLLIISVGFASATSLIFLGIALTIGQPRLDSLVPGHSLLLIVLMFASLLGASIYKALSFWAVRVSNFGSLARTRLIKATVAVAIQVGWATAGMTGPGLIIGDVTGRYAGNRILAKGPLRQWRTTSFKIGHARRLVRDHWRFPAFSIWAAAFNAGSFHMPVLLLARLFAEQVVGWFSLGLRVLQLPIALIGQALGQAFFSELASWKAKDILAEQTAQVLRFLTRIGMGPILLVSVAGADMFALIFGPEWFESGRFAQWLSPWILLVFIASPISTVVYASNNHLIEVVFQATLLVVRLGSIWIGRHDVDLAIGLYSITSAIVWIGYLIWLLKVCEIPILGYLLFVLRRTLRTSLMLSPVLIVYVSGIPSNFGWMLSAAIVLGDIALSLRQGWNGRE